MESFKIPPESKRFGLEVLNLLIVGEVGSGKSSFINQINSIFLGRYDPTLAPAGRVAGSFTRILNKLDIFDLSHEIRFWDLFGIEGDNYARLLSPLIEGRIREGIDIMSSLQDMLMPPDILNEVHGAIIVFDILTLNAEERMAQLKTVFDEILMKSNLNPIYVIF